MLLKNYVKIGWRNLLKNRLFSIINITGMAISIASFLLIGLFVYDEYQYDVYVSDADLKFRVYNEVYGAGGDQMLGAMVPPTIAPTLKKEYPEVDEYFRLMSINSSVLFEAGTKKMTETRGGYGDPTFFEMFSRPLVEGSAVTALKNANTVAISATLARKYFGDKPALGETLELADEKFVVDAVFEDLPKHSHLRLDYLMSMETLVKEIPERMEAWYWQQFHTYIKLKGGADASAFNDKLVGFAERNAWPHTKPRTGGWYIPKLMPLKDIHLHSSAHAWDIAVRGNIQTVYILSVTALFILVIAILNFINLSTACAVNRMKEVGVRKVVGAARTQLIYQFISESVIIALLAMMISIVVAELLLPFMNLLTEKSITANVFLSPQLILMVMAGAVLIGIAAGAYPAFFLSSQRPVTILSGKRTGLSGKTILRRGLVVVQFMLSFFLIIASFVVSDQHAFMRTTDIGFNKDNLLVVPLRGEMKENFDMVKNAFLSHPNIVGGSLGYGLPGQAFAGDVIIDRRVNKELSTSLLTVDHDYIKTLGINLVAGRDFSKDHPSDSLDAFIISESAARMLGYTKSEDALGHELAWAMWHNGEHKNGKVIGVVSDFHLSSMRESITPVVLHIYPFAYNTLSMKVTGTDLAGTVDHVDRTWKRFNSEWPFEYKFLDDNFDQLYKSEEKLAVLFQYFTGFSIFVACFGLFGLVVFSTAQKYKEISIRKVFGAGEGSIMVGLTRNFVLLICLAFLLAAPISYLAASEWLQSFVYRIDLSPIIFLKAALLILLLSVLTIGIQSWKAARSNPVNALKDQ